MHADTCAQISTHYTHTCASTHVCTCTTLMCSVYQDNYLLSTHTHTHTHARSPIYNNLSSTVSRSCTAPLDQLKDLLPSPVDEGRREADHNDRVQYHVERRRCTIIMERKWCQSVEVTPEFAIRFYSYEYVSVHACVGDYKSYTEINFVRLNFPCVQMQSYIYP